MCALCPGGFSVGHHIKTVREGNPDYRLVKGPSSPYDMKHGVVWEPFAKYPLCAARHTTWKRSIMRTVRFFVCTFAFCVLLPGMSCGAEEWIHDRDGMPGCPTRLKPDSYINVVGLGGPVMAGAGASHEGAGYRSAVMGIVRKEFNAHMGSPLISGGAGSWWGACCGTYGQAVYGQHLPAGIMFIDLAADDEGSTEEEVLPAVEGLVRSMWKRYAVTDLVFLYGLNPKHMEVYRRGELPDVIKWHEKVAAHYGIPSVNMGLYAAKKIMAGELTLEAFSADGKYPTNRGHALYAEAVRPLIMRAKATGNPAGGVPKRKMPEPLTRAPLEEARCVAYDRAKMDAAWRIGQESPDKTFLHLAVSDVPGATVTFRFKGDQAGGYFLIGDDAGDVEVSVDGGPWTLYPLFGKGRVDKKPQMYAQRLAKGVDPAQWHELRLRVAASPPSGSLGRRVRLGALLVNGTPFDPYEGLTPLQRIDAVYAGMDPLNYTPPADRWTYLPKTSSRLREGGTLNVVMLGDSIIGNTANSQFNLLLERMYPKAKLDITVSTRGSTGCWWYKDENRVGDYVLKHHPDLLIIGGISQRDDVASIREVIHQVRAKQQPEILLLTPVFGFTFANHIAKWSYELDPNGTDYRATLKRMAAEEKCAFMDMTGVWWQYILDSGKCYGWFRGDAVHANERGCQIIGRLLEKFFAPKE